MLRVYVDTNVYSGCFDKVHEEEARDFFDFCPKNDIIICTSSVVHKEIKRAPVYVYDFYKSLPSVELEGFGEKIEQLADAYVVAGVISGNHEADVLHIATATVHECSAVVSFNFKHIVNENRIPRYNFVNLAAGYKEISILAPRKVEKLV